LFFVEKAFQINLHFYTVSSTYFLVLYIGTGTVSYEGRYGTGTYLSTVPVVTYLIIVPSKYRTKIEILQPGSQEI